MDHMDQNDRDNAVVPFTHPHHEDLVDANRSGGRPFARGVVVEGTNVEIVSLGPDLMTDFDHRRQFAKLFLVTHLLAFKTYARVMIAASERGVSRTFWYLARYAGRVQERIFIEKSLDAVHQLIVMSRIINVLEVYHKLAKPGIDHLNLAAGIAIVCFSALLSAANGFFACLLLGFTVLHMVNIFYPIVVHMLLGLMIRKSKKIVDDVAQKAKKGRITDADIEALDDWKFSYLEYVAPKERNYINVAL
ncbi:hypothetical protein LCI18_014195 [Fusarium solani-melongenae]|uniref:Uncharacterized protein n=1 Tax=Fusarium solani subsp. cucurbitae TaxID=2747967 RepID=A0ACD3ZPU7_FUSSC|nr:hypothetical protein LCI18_014195 [Fusarium solani-melongenae]